MNEQRLPFKSLTAIWCAILLLSGVARADLQIYFDTEPGVNPATTYLSFQGSQSACDITYDNGADSITFSGSNIMSNPVSLQDIGSGGLDVVNSAGLVAFVSYGSQLSTAGVPSFIGSGGYDYNTPYQPFELTYTGNTGDQGDMTAINYFTAPMGISSYNSTNGTGTPLQTVGYTETASQIGNLLNTIAPGSAVMNTSNQVVRYLGPSSYGGSPNPYPSFVPYAQSINGSPITTTIENLSGFNNMAGTPTTGETTYQFKFTLDTTFGSDGTITMSGHIDTTVIPYGQASSAGPTFNNITVTISAANAAAFNQVIYGQSDPGGAGSAVSYPGAGWATFQTYLNGIATSFMTESGVYGTLQAQMVGEITSGMLGGFVNSSTPSTQYSGTEIGNLPSYEWWSLSPQPIFSQLQSNPEYYNQYSSIIYAASNNGAYSIPYSDRFGSGPLINSDSFNSTSVGSWVITLDTPVPEPTAAPLAMGLLAAPILMKTASVYKARAKA